jgi:hypothetical protein
MKSLTIIFKVKVAKSTVKNTQTDPKIQFFSYFHRLNIFFAGEGWLVSFAKREGDRAGRIEGKAVQIAVRVCQRYKEEKIILVPILF